MGRRTLAVVGLAVAVFAGVTLAAGTATGAAGPVGAGDITVGPDGNLWFTEFNGNRIGRITPAGIITEFSRGISPKGGPVGIAAGPDGNLWFTERGGSIGRMSPVGAVTEFSAGISPRSASEGIAAGPDGNMWFTESVGNRIGRITPAGVVTEFSAGISRPSIGLGASNLGGIAAGPDGNMWFKEELGNRIGRITPAGVVTEFPARIGFGSALGGITEGPDGNMWFTDDSGIGRITPAGVVTEFSTKSIDLDTNATSDGIALGPDGNLWFTELSGIGRITPAGVATEFSTGVNPHSSPESITAGPDGNLWFTEPSLVAPPHLPKLLRDVLAEFSSGSRIGRITTAGVISEFPPTALILSVRRAGTGAVAVRLRCPSGAARACRGALKLGLSGAAGVRRFTLAPGRRAQVLVPLTARARRLLVTHGRWVVRLWLLPEAHSLAGSLSQRITLRVPVR